MVFPKVFPTQIHALHLEVDIEDFMKEWKECVKDPKRDLTSIIQMLEPFICHWMNLLKDRTYPRDIQISTLCQCLDKSDYSGLETINIWIRQVDHLDAELRYILCEVIRHTQYYPSNARPIMVEYIFALLFRNYLRDHICRKLNTDLIALTDNELILDSQTIESDSPDIFLLERIAVTRWEKYLLYMIVNGFTTKEIATIVKLPRETFYYEEKHLWETLRNLWQQQEQ